MASTEPGAIQIEVAFDPIERLAKLPKGLFDPPGPVGLLPNHMIDDLLEPPVLLGFRILLATGLAIVVTGVYRRTWIPALVVAGLFAHQELVRSFSHVNHSELALLYVAAAICCFPLADAFSLARKRRPCAKRPSQLYSTPFLLAMLVLATTYFATGAARVWRGPGLFATDTLHDLVVVYLLDTGGLLGFGDLVARPLIELVPGWGGRSRTWQQPCWSWRSPWHCSRWLLAVFWCPP